VAILSGFLKQIKKVNIDCISNNKEEAVNLITGLEFRHPSLLSLKELTSFSNFIGLNYLSHTVSTALH
jgi:hypothetical protein